MSGEEITSSRMIFGWLIFVGIAFLLNVAPFIVGLVVLWFLLRHLPKPREPEEINGGNHTPTYTWEDENTELLSDTPLEPTVPEEVVSDAVSALQNLGARKVDAKTAVETAITDGATTVEEIIKQALQNLNRR